MPQPLSLPTPCWPIDQSQVASMEAQVVHPVRVIWEHWAQNGWWWGWGREAGREGGWEEDNQLR